MNFFFFVGGGGGGGGWGVRGRLMVSPLFAKFCPFYRNGVQLWVSKQVTEGLTIEIDILHLDSFVV